MGSPKVADESDPFVKLQNQLVNFRVRDVHFPEPEKILVQLYGNHLLQGWVTGVTDDGGGSGEFAIVEIEGLDKPAFVAVERILGVV